MNILAVTDIHSSGRINQTGLSKIITQENVDLLIIAGDLTTWGTAKLVEKILGKFNSLEIPILYIPGNMDAKKSYDIQMTNITPLHNKAIEFSGITFIGIGGSNPTPFPCPNIFSEEEINQMLETVKQTTEENVPLILVSHAPPKNSEADKVRGGQHVGSVAVRNFIEKYNPLAVICGHIHESKSISEIEKTLCINPGPMAHDSGALLKIIEEKEGKYQITARFIEF
ncbi:MAG: metallophosphoesterase family protein [Candidatus Heimdallarchaeota archaeon]